MHEPIVSRVVDESRSLNEEAIANWTHAIHLDEKYADAYRRRGDAYKRVGEWDASIADYTEAIRLDRKDAAVYASRGDSYAATGNREKAIADCTEAIRLDPKNFEAYYFNARACFQQGKLEEAARLFEMASKVNPDDYQAPQLLGMVYIGLGRKEDSQESYRRAWQRAWQRQWRALLWPLALTAMLYSAIRFVEAYGLWRRQVWAEWFGILSGGLYLPVEIYELTDSFTVVKISILVANLIIVGWLSLVRWHAKGVN